MADYRFPSPDVDARFPGAEFDLYFDNGGRFVGGADLRFGAPGFVTDFVFLVDADGAYLVDADGAYLTETV